jgi:hypothetical protein
MTTEAEIKERYKQIEREADSIGRIIGVRRLKPSEYAKVLGMTEDLEGFSEMEIVNDETGERSMMQLPHRGTHMIAASVCEIKSPDDSHAGVFTFPRNRAELDAVLDRLDMEGIAAAGKASQRLNADRLPAIEALKNS